MLESSMMGSNGAAASASSSDDVNSMILELKKKHEMELKSLTLVSRPFKTLHLFVFATLQYVKGLAQYVFRRGGWFVLFSIVLLAFMLLMTIGGPHDKHVQEILSYSRFVLWWVALGVASSIGLGSGLHTFVLYLGPHIALFTIKAMQCGRVDLKTAPYDTIQLKKGPSWLDKDCSEFGPPLFPHLPGSRTRIPFSSILPQVQLEAILWGIGTALGELPPYFISRAASIPGSSMEAIEIDATSSKEDGLLSRLLKQVRRWFLAHAQHLNFFMILVLASVPNPLFDLAGIMCGQFGIPFWKFFLATLIGKAIIKTHIQTAFIISVCNNQLLEIVEHELMWILGLIPGFSSMLPNIVAKLHKAKEKYLSGPIPDHLPSNVKAKRWNLSFTLIWNTIVWLMLLHFFVKIVTTTAQAYLKRQHEIEIELANRRSALDQMGSASD